MGRCHIQCQCSPTVLGACYVICAPDIGTIVTFAMCTKQVGAVVAALLIESGRLPNDIGKGRQTEIWYRIGCVTQTFYGAFSLETVDQRRTKGHGV